MKPSMRFLGLFQRRQILFPTWRGWLLLLAVGAGLGFGTVKEIYPFLAPTEPVVGGVLVAEGWLPDYAFNEVVNEFRRNHYDKLYITGGPIEKGTLSSHLTYAESGAAIAVSKGLPSDAVQAVSAPSVNKDRTYASAVALRGWLLKRGIAPKSYNVMTLGAHARRTRLLFGQALGEDAIVGVTAIEDPNYDPKYWWNTSAGVRTVVGEAIAYAYATLLFWPPAR